MKKKFMIIMLIATAILLAACAAKAASIEAPVEELRIDQVAGAMPLAPAEKDMVESYQSVTGNLTSDPGQAIAVERVVLKNADLSIVVPDPAASMDKITRMAEQMGGYVVSSSLSKYTTDTGLEVPVAYITIRVPADQLTKALDEIKGQTEKPDSDVLSENISGQDVTAEYTDLQSRVTNLELAEKQLQQILSTTTKTEDWLQVFNQLTQTRSDIEVLKGQIKYYDESARFSSVSVNLQAQEAVKPITVGKWEPKGIARDAIQVLVSALKVVVNIVIYLGLLIIPLLIVIIGPIWLVIWLIRRSIKRRKAAETSNSKK
jgi:uncharacterized lipoprotein YehR (DUF1307 family)